MRRRCPPLAGPDPQHELLSCNYARKPPLFTAAIHHEPFSPTSAIGYHHYTVLTVGPAITMPSPRTTSHELNGWGDEIVHDYLRGVEHNRRLGVLYSNKDYGCEWDYDWRNKRLQRLDNTRFASLS
jgi:hypothetical protein